MEPQAPHEEYRSPVTPHDHPPYDTPPAQKQRLSVPIAIIIAGIIIAGAVVYIGKNGGGGAAEEQQGKTLAQIAGDLKINKKKFQTCIDERRYKDRVQKDLDEAINSGGNGTPYNIVMLKDGRTTLIPGAQPPDVVKKTLDDALAGTIEDAKVKVPGVTGKDHVFGNRDAQVLLIEYSDLQCPFCQRFHGTVKDVLKNYKPEQVAWVLRHFPLESIHQNARPLAEAAECAAEFKGDAGFWKFVDGVFGY